MQYTGRKFSLRDDEPSDEWIKTSFLHFVRTEFSARESLEIPRAWRPSVVDEIEVDDGFLERFLAESEAAGSMRVGSSAAVSPGEMATRIFELLCHPRIGSKLNAGNNNVDEFVLNLAPTIEEEARLLFVLPGFPFKDQNRFRVPFDGDTPDLAEVSFLIRLHRLTQALYQVHPYGADVVVLSDGSLYQDIFGVPTAMVEKYLERLLGYRNRLNLQGTVSVVSLKELIDRASTERTNAWNVADRLAARIGHLVASDSDSAHSFDILVAGMKWNHESRVRLANLDDEVCWQLLRWDMSRLDVRHHGLWQELHGAARTAALRYVSVNLMLRWLDLIRLFFPGSIRGTIHPKQGQFSLAGSGGAYAWNGVAWSSVWPSTIDCVEVKPFISLSDQKEVVQVKFRHSGRPAFYTHEKSIAR